MKSNLNYYVIKPFIRHNAGEQLALQHRRGVLVISDSKIKQLIPNLEERIGNKIGEEDLKLLFKENFTEYLKFFLENKIIKKVLIPNFNIEEIHFFSNSSTMDELLSRAFEETNYFYNHKDISSFTKKINSNSNHLFIVFLNPYDRDLARKLRDLFMKNKNTLSLFSYIYYGRLYIESIYSSKWKNPCHICQFTHIESELKFGAAHGVTYQQIIDYLYIQSNSFNVETPLDFSDALNVSSQIVNRLTHLLALRDNIHLNMEEFTRGVVMDIDSKKTQLDTTYHWELCDCYD